MVSDLFLFPSSGSTHKRVVLAGKLDGTNKATDKEQLYFMRVLVFDCVRSCG